MTDFISQYSIALKEASETEYWLKIMIKSELVSPQKFSLITEGNYCHNKNTHLYD